MHLRLARATVADAPLIRCMQQEAFAPLLAVYQDYDTNPALESLERIGAKLRQAHTYYYLIEADGAWAGGIRIVDKGDGSPKRISPLFVLPRFRRRGIAQEAIRLAEALHGPEHWSLDTPLQEAGNCALYEKMGYRRSGQMRVVSERMTLVVYEKSFQASIPQR